MAKTIAAGPELAVGSNSWPCRNNALSRNLSCITPPPQQPEPISSPSGWHFQPVGKKIKPERGRKRTRGVLSWNCRSVAVSVQRSTINTEESRDQIGTASHYKYRRIQEPRSAQRLTLNTAAYRQKSTVLHIKDVTLLSVPNGVGARGRAFGLRNFEIAFPRTYRIENATGVAPSSEESYYKKQHNKQQ